MMFRFAIITILAGTAAGCSRPVGVQIGPAVSEESTMKSTAAAALQVTLVPSTLRVQAGAPVPLQMQVHNPTAKPVTFCTYHTLFEGLRNNLFQVHSDAGVEVPYRGMMAKRAPPSASDHRTLKPGETIVSDAVDVGEGYALPAGRYRVAFEGNGISGLSASLPIVVDVVDVGGSPTR